MNKLKFRHINLKQESLIPSMILNFIRNHITLVLLFPTIIGGLVQILELAKLGLPFIKYFSYSQVIPDGLTYLITFFVLIIVLTYVLAFSKYMLGRISISSSKNKILIHNTIVVIIINLCLLVYSRNPFELTIGVVFLKLFFILSGVILVFYLIILFLYFFVYFYVYFKNVDFSDYHSSQDYLLDKIDENKKIVVNVGLFFVAIFTLILSSNLSTVNDIIGKEDNVGNFRIFVEKIRESSHYTVFPEVLYFNREYIFVDIKTKKHCACDYVKI